MYGTGIVTGGKSVTLHTTKRQDEWESGARERESERERERRKTIM